MTGRFVLGKSPEGTYRFLLESGDGEVVLVGTAYEQLASVHAGIEAARSSALRDERFERLTSGKGERYFTLKGPGGQVVGTSAMYPGTRGRDTGIEIVKRTAPAALLHDTIAAGAAE